MDASIWGFIGTIVGSLVSIATTYINNNHSIKLKEKTDKLKQEQEFKIFQRKNLLDIQDILRKLTRCAFKIYLEDKRNYKITKTWKNNHLSDGIDEKYRSLNSDLNILIVRIADDDLRKELNNFRKLMVRALFAETELESEKLFNEVTRNYEKLNDNIGEHLRQYF